MRPFLLIASLGLTVAAAHAQSPPSPAAADTDRDGISDTLEDALLQRFAPTFYLAANDCSIKPARFTSGIAIPTPEADDGTIYGQAFPRKATTEQTSTGGEIELHFYHLWRSDCGRMGHALDTEHVAVLLRGSGENAKNWKAIYWYAAAHEDTLCDASQITRASAIGAEDGGASVWISAGKHASYLNQELCRHGCGGDQCEAMEPMHITEIRNLGESDAPSSGSLWIASSLWPLQQKMSRSDFREPIVQRLDALPSTDIAWAEPAKRPAQAAILGGNRGIDGALIGSTAGAKGIAVGNQSTDTALSLSAAKTKGALQHSFQNVGHALGKAAHKTGKAINAGSNAITVAPK